MVNKIAASVAEALAGIKDGSTILVGGFGLIGSKLVSLLRGRDHEVIAASPCRRRGSPAGAIGICVGRCIVERNACAARLLGGGRG